MRNHSRMAKFRKSMLKVGTLFKGDSPIDITPERLKHWESTFKRFKTARLKVPMAWGHASDAKDSQPLAMASGRRRGKVPLPEECVGFLDDFKVHPDGNQAELTFEIRRDEDASKVDANLVDASPVIFEKWVDGDNTAWSDVITHVDLVNHPVDHHQGEFKRVKDESSEMICCSLNYFPEGGASQVFTMQSDGEAANNDGGGDGGSNDNEGDGNEANSGKVSDQERLGEVVESLAAMEIMLSADTNVENFLEHLHQALLTAKAMGDETMGQGATEQATPDVAVMSLDTQALKAHAEKQHRTTVQGRLNDLLATGRATPAEVEARTNQVSAIALSLDKEGNHAPTAIETWIEGRESVPQGTFWDSATRTKMSHFDVTKHPKDILDGDADPSTEEADDIVDGMFSRRGARQPAKSR